MTLPTGVSCMSRIHGTPSTVTCRDPAVRMLLAGRSSCVSNAPPGAVASGITVSSVSAITQRPRGSSPACASGLAGKTAAGG
jgi:hypothetical protein